MADAEYLRDQAERCLRLAKKTMAPDVAETLRNLAMHYVEQAKALEREAHQQGQRGIPPPPSPPQQGHQPVLQQEQIQPKDDDA
jgi:hypothetical protein